MGVQTSNLQVRTHHNWSHAREAVIFTKGKRIAQPFFVSIEIVNIVQLDQLQFCLMRNDTNEENFMVVDFTFGEIEFVDPNKKVHIKMEVK